MWEPGGHPQPGISLGLGGDALGSLVLCCPIPTHATPCVLQVALAGRREMIKAAFDEAKINKQAGNCAGLYLLRMTMRSRRGEAAEAGSHIKRRDSAGREETTPLPLLQRVFPGPKNPGRSMCSVPHSRAPSHASRKYWDEQEMLCAVVMSVGCSSLGCILEVPLGTFVLAPWPRVSIPTSFPTQ